jgi:hypothetical protein
MKVTVVFASGKDIDFECDDAEVKKDGYGNINGLTLTRLTGRHFLWIRLANVDAVLYEKKGD